MFYKHLLDDFDPIEYMENNGYPCTHVSNKTEYLTDCPFCGKEKHFGITVSKKVTGCYKCRNGGNYLKLIQQVSNLSFFEAVEVLKKNVKVSKYNIGAIDLVLTEMKSYEDIENRVKPIQLPSEYISLYDKRIPYLDTGRAFPIPQRQVNYYQMGLANEGLYKNRLFICDINDKNQPIYWVARDITGKVDKKWKVLNPSQEYTSIGSADILFNYSLAKKYKTCIITEGMFDAMYVGSNAVAAYGKGLKRNHLYWLIKAEFERIILLFDADVVDDELEKDASMLSQFFDTFICKLPEGDPDEYEKPKLMEYLKQSKLYDKSKLDRIMI